MPKTVAVGSDSFGTEAKLRRIDPGRRIVDETNGPILFVKSKPMTGLNPFQIHV